LQSEIASSLVTIRSLRTEFIGAYLEHFSPAVRASLHATSLETEREYLAARLDSTKNLVGETVGGAKKDKMFFYCIFEARQEALIGAIEIRARDESAGQLYCWINEKYWGAGHFQQALKLAAQEYFAQTGELFFTAHVDVANMRSYGALRKAGFAPLGFHAGPNGKQHVLLLRRPVYACTV
jgi:RimJ/RimL family protein N-acetyltransferase